MIRLVKLKYHLINIGAQTERSKRNFPVGKEHMPIEVIYGFAQLKEVPRLLIMN